MGSATARTPYRAMACPAETLRHLDLIVVSDHVGEFFNDIRHKLTFIQPLAAICYGRAPPLQGM
jgi:hypothetical protein